MCISLLFRSTLTGSSSAAAVSSGPGGPLDRCMVLLLIYRGTGGDLLMPNLNSVISHVQRCAVCRALRCGHTADKRHEGDWVLEAQLFEFERQNNQLAIGLGVTQEIYSSKQILQNQFWCQAIQRFGSILFVLMLIGMLFFFFLSRWKFTFYLYIFTYGVRFLKKVSFAQIQIDLHLSNVTVTIPWKHSRQLLKDVLDVRRENLVASHEAERRHGRLPCEGLF